MATVVDAAKVYIAHAGLSARGSASHTIVLGMIHSKTLQEHMTMPEKIKSGVIIICSAQVQYPQDVDVILVLIA